MASASSVPSPSSSRASERPPHRRLVQLRGHDLGPEADQRAEPEPVGHVAEVVEQHLLAGEVLWPVVALREGVAVEEVGHVDAAARVRVLEPGAADVVVLLEDHHLDAGLVEPVGRHQARHAGADHRDAERPVGRDVLATPRRGPEVLAEGELIPEQLEVVVAGAASGDEGQEAPELVEGQRLHLVAPLGSDPLDGFDGGRLRLEHLRGRHAEGRVHEHRQIRAQVVGGHRRIVQHPRERGEQRRQHAELNSGGDRLVVRVGQRSGQVSHPRILAPPSSAGRPEADLVSRRR